MHSWITKIMGMTLCSSAIELLDIITQPFLNGLESYTGLKFTLVSGQPLRENSSKFQVLVSVPVVWDDSKLLNFY